jgi:hypothetical protein
MLFGYTPFDVTSPFAWGLGDSPAPNGVGPSMRVAPPGCFRLESFDLAGYPEPKRAAPERLREALSSSVTKCPRRVIPNEK